MYHQNTLKILSHQYVGMFAVPDRLLLPTWSLSGQILSHYHTISGDWDPDRPCGPCGPYIVRSGLVRVMLFCWWFSQLQCLAHILNLIVKVSSRWTIIYLFWPSLIRSLSFFLKKPKKTTTTTDVIVEKDIVAMEEAEYGAQVGQDDEAQIAHDESTIS